MQCLLDIGVNVHSKNNEGKTALHIAAQKGNTQIIEALINQQSQIDPIDKQGGTPFHLAIYHGHLSVANQLKTLGADIKLKTSKGSNALHLAAGQGHVDIVEWLLKKSLNINEPNNTSKTPLHVAAAMGRLSVVKQLLHLGAAVHLQDQQGQTALHLAAQNNHIDVFTELIHDSDPTTMLDKAGQSPLDLAMQAGHFELLAQYYSTIIDHSKSSKSTTSPSPHPFKHIKTADCIAHIEAYYTTTASKEQTASKDNAVFQHAVLPLLKTHLTTASAEVQASFIAYIEAGYPVYPDILQEYPVEVWVDNLLLRSMVVNQKDSGLQQVNFYNLQPKVKEILQAWNNPTEVTHFLFSLYDKQLTHQLSPATIETILYMVAELSQKDAFSFIEKQDIHPTFRT